MKYIDTGSTNPYWNLAVEEYVQSSFYDDTYILLWQNESTIVIGRNQNALEEICHREAEHLGVTVVRRNTGGGAVYHDMGNLNFSFITHWIPEENMDYNTFVQPVISALADLGVTARKSGRNDIVVDDRKISGNAQCIQNGRILHHGTLLLNSDLSIMPQVLRVSSDKIASKGIKSVRSRVANISEFLPEPISVDYLKSHLLSAFFQGGEIETVELTPRDKAAVQALVEKKYSTWEWNFGSSPKYTYKNAMRFPSGQIEVFLQVASGQIMECRIMGDFLALFPIDELEHAINGVQYTKPALEKAIASIDTEARFGIRQEDLLTCLTAE